MDTATLTRPTRRSLSYSQIHADAATSSTDLAKHTTPQRPMNKGKAPDQEIYGLVGYYCIWVVFIFYVVYALVPDPVLRHYGIILPSKWWVVAIPVYICSLWVFLLSMYLAVNLYRTPTIDSLDTIRDEYTVHVTFPVKPVRLKTEKSGSNSTSKPNTERSRASACEIDARDDESNELAKDKCVPEEQLEANTSAESTLNMKEDEKEKEYKAKIEHEFVSEGVQPYAIPPVGDIPIQRVMSVLYGRRSS